MSFIIIGAVSILIIAVITLMYFQFLRPYMPYLIFGRALKKMRRDLGHNLGALFLVNNGDSIGLPQLINLEDYAKTLGKKQYLYVKEQMRGLRFMGLPMIIMPTSDTKTSLGIYYQDTDSKGNPEFIKDATGKYILDKKGEKMPKLVEKKPSISLPPELAQSIIMQESINMSIKDIFAFIARYKNIGFWILGVVVIAAGGSLLAYLQYDYLQQTLPGIVSNSRACVDMQNVCITAINTGKEVLVNVSSSVLGHN